MAPYLKVSPWFRLIGWSEYISSTSKQKVNPLSFAVNSSPKFFHNRLNFNQSQIYRMIPSMSIFDIYDYLSPFIHKYAIIFVWLLIGFRFIDLSMSTHLIILFMLGCIPGNISIIWCISLIIQKSKIWIYL